MIDYELAKELKDVGFPQKGKGETFQLNWAETTTASGNTAYIPTLSELIEACGEGFTKLLRCRVIQIDTEGVTYMFRAIDFNGLSTELYRTPEEAVARLCLALNKK